MNQSQLVKQRTEIIFEFIVQYKRNFDGCSPSFREMRNAAGLASTSGVWGYLEKLEEQNRIMVHRNFSRHIEVIGGRWKYTAGDRG